MIVSANIRIAYLSSLCCCLWLRKRLLCDVLIIVIIIVFVGQQATTCLQVHSFLYSPPLGFCCRLGTPQSQLSPTRSEERRESRLVFYFHQSNASTVFTKKVGGQGIYFVFFGAPRCDCAGCRIYRHSMTDIRTREAEEYTKWTPLWTKLPLNLYDVPHEL